MWDAGGGGGWGGWGDGRIGDGEVGRGGREVDKKPRFRILDGYVGDTGKSSSVWTSCYSKKLIY